MGVPAVTYSSPTKTGVAKRRKPRRSSTLKTRRLRGRDRFFWLSAPNHGASYLMNSNNSILLEQVNDYTFAPSQFRDEPYPATFPPGCVWPPLHIDDLVGAIGSDHDYSHCVGNSCYSCSICEDLDCTHTLSDWKDATSDWENHFELRMTEHRGVGVYTKRAFRKGTILGWYSGELKTISSMTNSTNAYLMEMEIGDLSTSAECVPTVYIDGEQKGNWTRFINHSCAADCVFRIMRVGSTRIMAVEAIQDIPRGKELSVDYGPEYYGLTTQKVCACGVPECVSLKRAKLKKAVGKHRVKTRSRDGRSSSVKRCKLGAPPVLV